MRPIKWKNVAETAGFLAILAGLFFVYEELRLSRTVARAELSAESARMLAVLDEQERNPEFAKVLVKSRNNSDELTPSEQVQLDSYLHGALMVYIRELYNYRREIFDEFTSLIRATAPRRGRGFPRNCPIGNALSQMSTRSFVRKPPYPISLVLFDATECVAFMK